MPSSQNVDGRDVGAHNTHTTLHKSKTTRQTASDAASDAANPNDPPGDAVIVFTPDNESSYNLYTIQCGIHVLLTKPATQLLSHCHELIEASRKHNVICFVEHHKRFDPYEIFAIGRNNLSRLSVHHAIVDDSSAGLFLATNSTGALYDHVSSMWFYEGWVPEASVEYAHTHYAAYSIKCPDGLRIISIDADMWYTYVFMHYDPQSSFTDRPNCRSNYFSYINATQPDPFGILRFLTDELQDAEDSGTRVWIVGHVLSGWDGTQSELHPTNLFYQIVDRYLPHVIANIFFGHTHEDQLSISVLHTQLAAGFHPLQIFYATNATNASTETAQMLSWIIPSLTPLTNLNSGFRVHEVDSAGSACLHSVPSHRASFRTIHKPPRHSMSSTHTRKCHSRPLPHSSQLTSLPSWISHVDDFPVFDNQMKVCPMYVLEYSTREAYSANMVGRHGPAQCDVVAPGHRV
ncbi:hypothetical protein BU15DRAFT_75527 [Melanogaster broomeanus]|nr:hypothetical protein BU15DRAFT_75527 [Melanogaster broomeanus]